MAFPRTNCRTTTATVLTATAGATLSLRVCLYFSSQPLSQDDDGGCLRQCLLPKAARHGQALCHLSRHGLSRHTSQSHPPRTGSTAVFVRGKALHKKKRTSSVHGVLWERLKMTQVDCFTPYHKSIDSATSATRATPSSSWATTMAVASEVCLVVISQDTSLETVLWIHFLLRTLSWCKVSPQLLDGNDGGDCVKSSSDAGVRTLFDLFFRVCNVSRSAFSGDVNTQNHTWTSGLPSLVINIVFFVAFLWMRCLPPSLSLVVHIFRLFYLCHHRCYWIMVQYHANFAFFRRTGDSTGWTCNF